MRLYGMNGSEEKEWWRVFTLPYYSRFLWLYLTSKDAESEKLKLCIIILKNLN
jgi:hypothetical protein